MEPVDIIFTPKSKGIPPRCYSVIEHMTGSRIIQLEDEEFFALPFHMYFIDKTTIPVMYAQGYMREIEKREA